MKLTLLTSLLALSALPLFAEPNKACPIMTDDGADPDIKVSYQGRDIFFCCSPCVKQFKKEPDYYVRLFQVMKSVPAVQDVKVAAEVTLLDQRFCPVSQARLVGPASPSVEYKGVKVYLSKPGSVTVWNTNPDKYAKEAFEKDLLPQLKDRL